MLSSIRIIEELLRGGDRSALSQRARRRRWDELCKRFPHLGEMTVVDLGGTERSWDLAPVKPKRLVIVNQPNANPIDALRTIPGDACDPYLLRGEQFDLVYSNSVIEHVGGYTRKRQFADTVHRLGDHHWVQTPNRYFPIEPHYWCPGFQFLPLAARAQISIRWPIGVHHQLTQLSRVDRHVVERALAIDLLSRTELTFFFPESEIASERFAGLTKSLIAVR